MPLQATHVDIVHQMVLTMSQLPGGGAGSSLSAIAASSGTPLTTACMAEDAIVLHHVQVFHDLETPVQWYLGACQ